MNTLGVKSNNPISTLGSKLINSPLIKGATSLFLGMKEKLSKVNDIINSATGGYSGEFHGVIKGEDGKFKKAQFMGPGTNLSKRLDLGDEGLSAVDRSSMAHDIRYSLIDDKLDKSQRQALIRDADNKFIANTERFRKEKKDNEFNLRQADLIKTKVKFEDSSSFIRDGIYYLHNSKSETDEATRNKYRNKLAQLESEGY